MSRGGDSKNSSVKIGRTIAQEWERQESESERLAARKKTKVKKVIKLLSVLAVITVVTVVVIMELTVWVEKREKAEAAKNIPQPTIEIIDEGKMGVTSRMKEYVAQLETDLKDLEYAADRAVVPTGKSREIHLFIKGYDFYVKYNIDRGTAVSAEDTDRMIKYVAEHDLHPEYIDVRVEGKGYLK